MNEKFPLHWNRFLSQYKDWESQLINIGRLTPVRSPFPGKNMMADEILGVYRLENGVVVELSAVTFRNIRCVGLTCMKNGEKVTPSDWGGDNLPEGFAALNEELRAIRQSN